MNLCRLLALLVLICLSMSVSADAAKRHGDPPEHDITTSSAKWGAYTIMRGGKPFFDRICIRDRRHKIVREIDCGECGEIDTQRISAGKVPDLLIVAWDGSNLYCTHTTYVFTQNGGLRNVAIIVGGEGEFRRLGRHGLQFVMESSGVLEYACNLCHACEPDMPVILDWHDGHTTDAARKYPALTKAKAASYRKDFHYLCAAWTDSQSGQTLISPAAGYYACEYELGHGPAAYRWIMHRLPTHHTREWFQYCAKIVRYQVSQIRHMTSVSQAKVLTAPDPNVFANPPKYPKMDSLSDQ